jgi:UDP-glucose 4-epimerase
VRTYLVTGGAGFIGSRLARHLADKGHKVFVLDDLSTGFERNIPAGSIFLKADISNAHELEELEMPERFDTVYHLAAQSSGEVSFDDPARDIDVNYKGTLNILRLAAQKKCQRFIFTSSMSVYGEVDPSQPRVSEDNPCKPVSYYGCNKMASEKLISLFTNQAGLQPTIFRLFNVYGPGQNMLNLKQGMVSIYFSYLMKQMPVQVKGSLDRFRDFVFIDDVVDALAGVEENKKTFGGLFNLGTGTKTSVRELLDAMLNAYGLAEFHEWVHIEGSTQGDIAGCIADTTRLKQTTGWTPRVDLTNGVRRMKVWIDETIDWWTANHA